MFVSVPREIPPITLIFPKKQHATNLTEETPQQNNKLNRTIIRIGLRIPSAVIKTLFLAYLQFETFKRKTNMLQSKSNWQMHV